MRLRATGAIALGVVVSLALAGFAACDLYTSGLGDAPGELDASVDAISFDVTLDAPVLVDAADPADAPDDAGPDAVADAPNEACAPLETDCTDGIDNDCNGLTDCADPACVSGYVCTPAPTAPFTGYALYDDDRTTACPTEYATQSDTYEDLVAPPATCTACSCAPATGTTCGASTLDCASAGSCTSGPTETASLRASCADFAQPVTIAATDSCAVTAPAAAPGTCAPSGGSPVKAPPSFGKLSRVCARSQVGGGCAAGLVCAPRATGGAHGVCVSAPATGTTLCPTGYPQAHVVSGASVTDSRGCTPCSCGAASGATCAGTATLHGATGCADGVDASADDSGAPGDASVPAPVTLAADGVCRAGLVGPPATFVSGALAATVAAAGACVPDGGTPTGTATPSAQTVYCCAD